MFKREFLQTGEFAMRVSPRTTWMNIITAACGDACSDLVASAWIRRYISHRRLIGVVIRPVLGNLADGLVDGDPWFEAMLAVDVVGRFGEWW